MAYQLGLVGLCTSHPAKWTPIIRELSSELDIEIAAAWDSGEVRPTGYAEEFCRKHDIPRAVSSLEEMRDTVDGVIVHSANWDRHLEQARPFVEADQGVLIDKPMVGNIRDAEKLNGWVAQGRRLTGGSSLHFAPEILQLLNAPTSQRGEFHTAHAVCGIDRFFYGVHGLAMLSGLLGAGLQSAQVIDDQAGVECERTVVKLTWRNGSIGILSQCVPALLPLHYTALSDQGVFQGEIDTQHVYREFLRRSLLYLSGKSASPPATIGALLEPELAAIAILYSRRHNGDETRLDHPGLSDVCYDGRQFAISYREARAATS